MNDECGCTRRQRNKGLGESVWCRCPYCGKLHKVYFEYGWTGNGTPRVGCGCKRWNVAAIDTTMVA